LWPGRIAIAQFAVVAAYTIGLSYANAALWLDPFGPLLKNFPIAIAILILAAVERER